MVRKIAVITGGNSGIGFATAKLLASKGVVVVLAARNAEKGRKAEAEIRQAGGEALFVQTDVSREADMIALFDTVRATYGRLDYLFNNAGIAEPAWTDFAQLTEAQLDKLLSINVKGVYMGIKHGMPLMAESGGGAIVNCSSPGGTIAFLPELVGYSASKAGVTAMTRCTKPMLAEKNIRTYAVGPFTTETPIMNDGKEITPELRAFFDSLNPSGRMGKPEHIATVVVALMEGTAPYQSGDMVYVDNEIITRLSEPAML